MQYRAGASFRLRAAALVVVLLSVILAVVFATRFDADPTLVRSPLIGQRVTDVTLPYLEQPGSLALRALEGEIVVVNFWASWCVPCREEHDDLRAAAETYRSTGVRFVGISYQDRVRDATRFLDEMGRGYDYVKDPGSRASIEFGVFGVPETFFVDRRGTIVAKITGASTFPLLASTLDQILLGRTPQSHRTGKVQSAPGG